MIEADTTRTFVFFFCFCRGLFPWGRVWTDRWLRVTGSWMVFAINFRNNYTMFAVTYAIPLITDRDYSYGQLENSYIYLALTITALGELSNAQHQHSRSTAQQGHSTAGAKD